MPCTGHPRLCCDGGDEICHVRRVSNAPAVEWSTFDPEAPLLAVGGSRLFLAEYVTGSEVWCRDDTGTELWRVDVGESTYAITADADYVWVSAGTEIVQLDATDGSELWRTDIGDICIAMDSDAGQVFGVGPVFTFGTAPFDKGCGIKLDTDGTILGVFGGENQHEGLGSYPGRAIVVGGGAAYVGGEQWTVDVNTAGADDFVAYPSGCVSRWNSDDLALTWLAGDGRSALQCNALGLKDTNLFVGFERRSNGGGGYYCTLEMWEVSTESVVASWGILTKDDAGQVVPVFAIDATAAAVWVLTGHSYVDGGGGTQIYDTNAEILRQYDNLGSLQACVPVGDSVPGMTAGRYYRHIAAFADGVYVSGTGQACPVDDTTTCPTDAACTPVDLCGADDTEANPYGLFVAGCGCDDGIGAGCVTVDVSSCPALEPAGNLTPEVAADPAWTGAEDFDIGWLATYDITACATTGSVRLLIGYTVGVGWEATFEISITGQPDATLTLAVSSEACDPLDIQFQWASGDPGTLPACLACGGDQLIQVRLRDACLMAMTAAPTFGLPARLMASIDGPADIVGLLLERDAAGDWTDAGGLLRFNEDIATIGDDDGPVTILSRRPFVAVATVGANELIVTEEP